jgi:hypothetical protein
MSQRRILLESAVFTSLCVGVAVVAWLWTRG